MQTAKKMHLAVVQVCFLFMFLRRLLFDVRCNVFDSFCPSLFFCRSLWNFDLVCTFHLHCALQLISLRFVAVKSDSEKIKSLLINRRILR